MKSGRAARIIAPAYSSVSSRPGTTCCSYARIELAAASSPTYAPTSTVLYGCHQPFCRASRAICTSSSLSAPTTP